MNNQQDITRVTEAQAVLEAVHAARGPLGHVTRELLTDALDHLAWVARGTAWTLNACAADGARKLAEAAENAAQPELAELAREVQEVAHAVATASTGQRVSLGQAHNTARVAQGGTRPGPGKYGAQAGEQAVAQLSRAAALMRQSGRAVIDAAGVQTVVGALERITSLLAALLDRCAHAAKELAERSTDEDAVERHRATARDVSTARRNTRELRRELERVHDLTGQLHELDARTRRS
ncbi:MULTISPECIES: hypothetical protein [Actinosynnema]|uniref:hypothetical protein n=1 Tax=Actinosynnema TaxID=40566 RepID=UPI0020A2B022|nr:hypothetical protein [Actinosynnema pretiosum]MCP2098983.1 hypothetical protein [Actinosynnema pretiosum]